MSNKGVLREDKIVLKKGLSSKIFVSDLQRAYSMLDLGSLSLHFLLLALEIKFTCFIVLRRSLASFRRLNKEV